MLPFQTDMLMTYQAKANQRSHFLGNKTVFELGILNQNSLEDEYMHLFHGLKSG